MRHFDHLAEEVRAELFHQAPCSFNRDSERSVLAHALGATLYVPATKENLADAVRRQAAAGAKSMVIDLEDAISDGSVESALTSTQVTLRDLHEDPPESLVFVRVRSADHIRQLVDDARPGTRHRQRIRVAEVLRRVRRRLLTGCRRCG